MIAVRPAAGERRHADAVGQDQGAKGERLKEAIHATFLLVVAEFVRTRTCFSSSFRLIFAHFTLIDRHFPGPHF